MTGFATLALVSAATWLLRIGFLVLIPARRLPPALQSSLDDLAPAVLTAIVAVDLTALLTQETDPAGVVETLAAAAIVGGIAWRTRSLAITVLFALVAVCTIDVALH